MAPCLRAQGTPGPALSSQYNKETEHISDDHKPSVAPTSDHTCHLVTSLCIISSLHHCAPLLLLVLRFELYPLSEWASPEWGSLLRPTAAWAGLKWRETLKLHWSRRFGFRAPHGRLDVVFTWHSNFKWLWRWPGPSDCDLWCCVSCQVKPAPELRCSGDLCVIMSQTWVTTFLKDEKIGLKWIIWNYI